jgi:hypothetical protein
MESGARIVTTKNEQFNEEDCSSGLFCLFGWFGSSGQSVNLLQPNKRDKPNKPNNNLLNRLD